MNLQKKYDNLRACHFFVKYQSSNLSNLKENLPNKNAITLLDFAANYNYITQDAV